MTRLHRTHPRSAGFTLVELMITLAIIAILSALAWPALREAVQKGRRADAMAALSSIMQAQERWRANRPTYQNTLADLTGASNTTSTDGHYDLSLVVDEATAASGYIAQATARSSSPQTDDTKCRTLQVVVAGGMITYRSLTSSAATNAAPDPCWVR